MANGDALPARSSLGTGVRLALAGFFPVGVFAAVLLLAMWAWGFWGGVVLGTLLASVTAWALVRFINAYVAAQWVAATVVGIVLMLFFVSLF